jgi:hypothetical protein
LKKVVSYLKKFWQEDFTFQKYGTVLAFLVVTVSVNYYYDFEDSIIDADRGKVIRVLWYFLLYCVSYYGTLLVTSAYEKDNRVFSNPDFWIKSLFCLVILSADRSFYGHVTWSREYLPRELYSYGARTFGQAYSLFTLLVPFALFYKLFDKKEVGWYGLNLKNFNWKPYLSMLLIMLPIIAIASFEKGFISYYPRYKLNSAAHFLGVPEWVPVLVYELVYGWDFMSVELTFRGFLVIGMTTLLGRRSVLPMVVTYCFLHFGKPPVEAIGSVFGGYILGVIAFYSRSIFGGVLLHVGVAWVMEIAAALQKHFR